jgi:hypothetical protein
MEYIGVARIVLHLRERLIWLFLPFSPLIKIKNKNKKIKKNWGRGVRITGNAFGADEPELDVICQLNKLFHAKFCVLTSGEQL